MLLPRRRLAWPPALLLAGILLACVPGGTSEPPAPVGASPSPSTTAQAPAASPASPASPTSTAVAPLAADARGCAGEGRRVCLVPLADFAEPPIDALVQHLLEQGIPAGSLPPAPLLLEDIDRQRSQLSANRALARVDATYPQFVTDPDVTVIALTDRDIFIEGAPYNWVFGMRGRQSLLISTARMYEGAIPRSCGRAARREAAYPP